MRASRRFLAAAVAAAVTMGGTVAAGRAAGADTTSEASPRCDRREDVTILGTNGDDRLVGTAGPDVIAGLGGNDTIEGRGGDDVVCGGSGSDTIDAGAGDDLVRGGYGDDVVRGGPGDDDLRGVQGNDRLLGGPGDDALRGNSGRDVLLGGPGDDFLQGVYASDRLDGGSGDDVLRGNQGGDDLAGAAGDDDLAGQKGPDVLDGGDGRDRCAGGPGRDVTADCESVAGTEGSLLADYAVPGDATYPEGVAYQPETGDVFASSFTTGAVYRGNLAEARLSLFLAPGQDGRTASTGLKVDRGRLYVAGGASGRFFVYDAATGALLRRYEAGPAPDSFVNDVAIAPNGDAYVTDSFRPVLYRVPADLGPLEVFRSFVATPFEYEAGFNANGVVVTEDGRYVLVVQLNTGELFRIDTATKEVTEVGLGGTELVGADGLVLDGQVLYVVQNGFTGGPKRIAEVELAADFARGRVTAAFGDPRRLDVPTTAAQVGDALLVVNSQLDSLLADAPLELPFRITTIKIPPR